LRDGITKKLLKYVDCNALLRGWLAIAVSCKAFKASCGELRRRKAENSWKAMISWIIIKMHFNLASKIRRFGKTFQIRIGQSIRHSLCYCASDAENK
jgi:hypothetical protein